mmetsp:Transcript_87107/g.243073  ORF Transcript_87107/g.243073 Transcript_87107/m.243073 type:complete len:1110 (-) Transcript_87107:103-3432(-)
MGAQRPHTQFCDEEMAFSPQPLPLGASRPNAKSPSAASDGLDSWAMDRVMLEATSGWVQEMSGGLPLDSPGTRSRWSPRSGRSRTAPSGVSPFPRLIHGTSRSDVSPWSTQRGVSRCTTDHRATAAAIMSLYRPAALVSRGPRFQVSFRQAMTCLPIMMVLVVWGCMFYMMESNLSWIRGQAIETCLDACHDQESAIEVIVYNNVTVAAFHRLLQSVSKGVTQDIKWPADHAVDAVWGYMRTAHALNSSWDGASAAQRSEVRYRAMVEIPVCNSDMEYTTRGWAASKPMLAFRSQRLWQRASASLIDGVYVSFAEGQFAGVAMRKNRSRACCPRDDLSYFDAGESNGSILAWSGDPVDVNGTEVASPEGVGLPQQAAVQEWLATAGNASSPTAAPAQGGWSEVYSGESDMRISWTVPLAYCGDYSCMSGVIAAEIAVRTVDFEALLTPGGGAVDYGENQDLLIQVAKDGRGSIFLVNHVSMRFPDQEGLLLSSSRQTELGIMAENSDQGIISTVSQAILDRYGSWNASTLQTEQPIFKVNLTAAAEGRFIECDAFEQSEHCFQIGTQSIAMDGATCWLAVVALPASLFNAAVVARSEEQLNEITMLNEESKVAVNEARVAMVFAFAGVAAVSIVVGLGLGCSISEPLRNLTALMQLLGNLKCMRETDAFRPLRSGRRSRIKDISRLEETFCTSLRAIEDFARFVPESVVQRIVDDKPRATRLHVDKKEVTIMFCTIKDFDETFFSSPEFATKCYAAMTHAAERFRGTVSEILSSGILVYWNTPDHVNNHKAWACAAALSIKQAIEKLNEQVNGPGRIPLRVQIGLHSGTVLAGNIGSDKFMKFGCLGDAVNLTSRMTGLCNIFGVAVVASGAAVEELVESRVFFARKLASVTVVGKQQPTDAYELLGLERRERTEGAAATPAVFQETLAPTPRSEPEGHALRRSTSASRSSACGPMGASRRQHAVGKVRSCIPCRAAVGAAPPAAILEAVPATVLNCTNPSQVPNSQKKCNRRQVGETSPCGRERREYYDDAVSPATRESAKAYEQALEAYERHDFQHAKAVAAKLAEGGIMPAQRLLERVEEAEQEEKDVPEEELPPWTGAWPVTKKK